MTSTPTDTTPTPTATAPATALPTSHRHPMIDNMRRSAPIKLEHNGRPGGLETTLLFRRPIAPILARAHAAFEELLQGLLHTAAELPEVVAYLKLRDRHDSIGDELERLRIAIAQLELDRRKLVAGDLEGEKLAAKLTKMDTQKKGYLARIDECNQGQRLFEHDVAQAKEVARVALLAHRKAKVAGLHDEVNRQNNAAAAAIEAETRFYELLDDAGVAARLGSFLRNSADGDATVGNSITARLNSILEPPVASPAPTAVAAPTEPPAPAEAHSQTTEDFRQMPRAEFAAP